MSFAYPLGLLGLIGIPLLIIIYILKNKHTEQVISSSYLWRLSERFLKRRNPISRLAGIISLILQILTVACISFAMAHPVFTLKNAADDYVFILDASGSMQYEQDGETRFTIAKNEIGSLIEDSANGSTYTLICAGEATGVLFEEIQDKDQALTLLAEAELSAVSPSIAQAHTLAQQYFTENPASKVYLVTDKGYDNVENVELVNVSSREENYAVAELQQTIEGGKMVVSGNAYSYESDAELNLVMEIDNGSKITTKETKVSAKKLEAAPFRFETENVTFQSVKVTVRETDALPMDNESVLFSVSSVSGAEEGGVLVVSDDPFFTQMAITSVFGENTVETVATEKYDSSKSGYQLYVFEGYSPEILPSDGAVWFINPQSSVENTGFSVQGTESLSEPRLLEYSTSTATRVRELLKGTRGDNIYVDGFVKCGFYRNFYTLLSYNGSPVVFAGTNSHDKRQVVFAFDFHRSDFILHFDYMVLMRNLLNYTFPAMLTETSFECGESVAINVLAGCDSIRVDTPNGDIAYLDTGSDLAEYTLTQVGVYTITQMIGDVPNVAHVYGNLPKTERASIVRDEAFVIAGTPSDDRRDGIYDDLFLLFIILAALFLADWMVYCYEQHQLR